MLAGQAAGPQAGRERAGRIGARGRERDGGGSSGGGGGGGGGGGHGQLLVDVNTAYIPPRRLTGKPKVNIVNMRCRPGPKSLITTATCSASCSTARWPRSPKRDPRASP